MKLHYLVLTGLALSGVAQAADIGTYKKPTPVPVIENDLYFGSIGAGASVIDSPSQKGLKSATVPYLNVNGKFTYMLAPRGWGAQVDANFAGLSTDWIDPKVRHASSAFIYGGALHLFSRAVTDAKIGGFFQFDQHDVNARQTTSLTMPGYVGGLEAQYALNHNLLLRARASLGSHELRGNGNAMTLRSYTGGLGVTYRFDRNWRLGADLNVSAIRASVQGTRGGFTFLETGVFGEYRLSQLPLSLRADVSYLHYYDDKFISARHIGLNGMRATLGVRYEFGGSRQRPRDIVDDQFQTYNVLAGLR